MSAKPSLRILMVAPQPFLRARGTPFSVLHRTRALVTLGHDVDLLTYPFGDPVELAGVRLLRARRTPGVRDVPIGPSFAKALSDIPLFWQALRMARRKGYDLVHTHEEAGALGAFIRNRLGTPHLYDMHSSLPQQLENFGRFDRAPFVRAFQRLERYILDGSDGVIAICDALGVRAREVGYAGPLQVIENTLDFSPPDDVDARARARRTALGIEMDAPVIVYTGSLEAYQGLEAVLESVASVLQASPGARFVIVGGTKEQSHALLRSAVSKGVDAAVTAIPAVPPAEVYEFLRMADILVTARSRGTNTPLKIYQYMRAGRPIVATDIHSHTQVLDRRTAELVTPDPEGISLGILRLLDDPERRRALAAAASQLVRRSYGEEVYHRRLGALLEEIPRSQGAVRLRTASARRRDG